MKAVILAAGAGTRLRPLTDTCPKPMLPVAGRPLLSHTLDWLRSNGIEEAALNLHHLPQVVRTGLGDGSAWDMRLYYSYEPMLLGTAGAVRQIDALFPGWFDQTFLLLYGDMLLDIPLDELVHVHRTRAAVLTMALKHSTTPHTQGMVDVNDIGRIQRFIEKPTDWQGGDDANAGVYVCEPTLINAIPAGISDFGHDVIPALLAANAPVYGHHINGYMLDIGTPAAYAQADQDWLRRLSPAN